MKRFIKNKFFILAVVLMVIAAAVPTVLTLSGKGSYVHNAVNVLMTPLQKGFNYVTDALDGFTSYFTKFDDVVKENARLKEEIASLYNRLYQDGGVESVAHRFSGNEAIPYGLHLCGSRDYRPGKCQLYDGMYHRPRHGARHHRRNARGHPRRCAGICG